MANCPQDFCYDQSYHVKDLAAVWRPVTEEIIC